MIAAGIDIGSRATKAVLLNQAAVLSSVIMDTGPESARTSEAAMQALLQLLEARAVFEIPFSAGFDVVRAEIPLLPAQRRSDAEVVEAARIAEAAVMGARERFRAVIRYRKAAREGTEPTS